MSSDLERADFVLVRMPYSALTQPDLATGLLKACLDRAGVSSKVVPANIPFAEEIGPVVHELLFTSIPHSMIGEWTFAAALTPDFQVPDEVYLDHVVACFKVDKSVYWKMLCRTHPYLDIRHLLRTVRDRAAPFVERMAREVLARSPRIVGCTSVFQQHCASLALLRRIKELSPTTVTIIGGANCEAGLGRATFDRFPWVDYVVSGDADGFIGSFAVDVLAHGRFVPADRVPPGVHGRMAEVIEAAGDSMLLPSRSSAVIVVAHAKESSATKSLPILTGAQAAEAAGAPIAIVDDMDSVPIPNYDDWFAALRHSKMGSFIHPSLPYMTSRGCWWGQKHHCTFCGISQEQMRYRSKSADLVLAELRAMKETYGVTSFQGTEYILDQRYFETLIPRLHELESHFRFEVKANLKPQQVAALRTAGVVEIQPGIESLHDEVLRLLDKGTTAALNIRILKSGSKQGMSIFWNMLHSVPGDWDDWYGEQAELLPLLHHLQPPAAFAAIHYDRFSVYSQRPEDYGLQLVPAWGYRYVYPIDDDGLLEMAYFFDNAAPAAGVFRSRDPERPGLRALARAVGEWQKGFRKLEGNERATLILEDLGDHAIVTDGRPVASAPVMKIEGLALHVMRLCDEGVGRNGLIGRLADVLGRSPGLDEIDPVIDDLVDRRLLVQIGGWYISLPVTTPLHPYAIDEFDDPALSPDVGLIRADWSMSNRTLASTCVKAPWDRPITESFALKADQADALRSTHWWEQ